MRIGRSWIPGLALSFLVAASLATPAAERGELPQAAAAAVQALFPGATLVGVGQERERGVPYYEVAVRRGTETFEIEVTPDGRVGEIETEMRLADVPPAARDGIAKLTGGAPIQHVERHEIHGVPRETTFAPVDPPVVFYEVVFGDAGARREIAVAEDGSPLPTEEDDAEEPGDDDSSEEEEEGLEDD